MRQIVSELQSINKQQRKLVDDLQNVDIEELVEEVKNYITAIQAIFQYLPKQKLDQQCLNDLETLLAKHQELTQQFENKRSNTRHELKQLNRGKVMQETYPNI